MDNLFFMMAVAPHFDGIYTDKKQMEATIWTEAGLAMVINFSKERSIELTIIINHSFSV